MKFLVFLDRIGERRLERARFQPRRPTDVRSFIGMAFLAGYYLMVLRFIGHTVPAENVALVRDSMLVLGPAVGAVVQSLFRTDVKDEITANNTGEGFRAFAKQADATKAAAEASPPAQPPADAVEAAGQVADAAVDRADEIAGDRR
jgi:hypothetical protein